MCHSLEKSYASKVKKNNKVTIYDHFYILFIVNVYCENAVHCDFTMYCEGKNCVIVTIVVLLVYAQTLF